MLKVETCYCICVRSLKKGGTIMIAQKRIEEEAAGEQVRKAAGSRAPGSDRAYAATKRYSMKRPSKMHITRYILPLALLTLVLLGLLTACAGQQQIQDPAGTSTQDPPIPQLTQATHGIVDTTGTVP